MKKRYVFAALAAMTVFAGCGDNASQQKNTDNTTQESTAEDDLTAADPDEDGEELDPEFSQDVENNEVIDADDAEEEAALDPITPSEYLVQNASDYVTLGDYDGVEVTRYTYEITDDMVQDEIQEELADASDEQSTNTPSEDGNIVYMNLTANVEGEEAADPDETFITLGQEEFGAEFDQKLTGVSTGDKLDFSITYGDDTWQEDWQGKTVDFSVEITDVTASNTPEYDEDYVKNYTGYDTKEEYEASVKEYLEQSYEEQSTYDETEDLISACLARTEFTGEYPDDLFEACREEALSGYSMFVEEDGDVNDVLDMNKLQSGDLKDQQILFDLTMVLRELNQIYDERAAKKGIRYEIDWKNGTYSHSALVGNPVYLGRILSNIMDNAIKFSQAGSVITGGGKEEALDDGRAFFTFYCKDQGVGMSEDFIAHAFDMFSQESETSRSRYEGTGLGLAITKQLVDRMDGSIELKSKAGVGTTVIVKIPFKIADFN